MSWFPLALAALASVAVGIGGCGSSGSGKSRLLSRSSADSLRSTLKSVEQLASAGNCSEAKTRATAFRQQVSSLGRVDHGLRSALESGGVRLERLVSRDCGATAAAGTSAPSSPVQQPAKEKKPKKNENKPGNRAKGKGNGHQNQNGNNGEGNDGVVITPNQGTTNQGTTDQTPGSQPPSGQPAP
jgi:hypothetical protein